MLTLAEIRPRLAPWKNIPDFPPDYEFVVGYVHAQGLDMNELELLIPDVLDRFLEWPNGSDIRQIRDRARILSGRDPNPDYTKREPVPICRKCNSWSMVSTVTRRGLLREREEWPLDGQIVRCDCINGRAVDQILLDMANRRLSALRTKERTRYESERPPITALDVLQRRMETRNLLPEPQPRVDEDFEAAERAAIASEGAGHGA